MKASDGLSHPPNHVYKLKKSLYGLKQASRQWFAKLTFELVHQGFTQSKNDYSLFIKNTVDSFILAAIYVDNIILTGNDIQSIQHLISHLHRTFSIKDLGPLSFFLGLEVTYLPYGISLTQRKFTSELLRDSAISTFKTVATPLPITLKLQQSDHSPPFSDPTYNRSLMGKLNFLTHTRPDLSYTVQTLSQYMQNLTTADFDALKHTLNYVVSTSGQGILLRAADQLSLHAFSTSG